MYSCVTESIVALIQKHLTHYCTTCGSIITFQSVLFDESKPRSVIRDFVARLITYAAVQTLPWICCVRERWGWWISLSGCTFGFWRWRMQHRNFDMENLGSLLLLRANRSMTRSLACTASLCRLEYGEWFVRNALCVLGVGIPKPF